MEVSDLIKKYLSQKKIMQLATVNNGQPWICTVHYAVDKDLNLYWLSNPARRHSQEIKNHSKVAATVVVKSPDNPVVAVQLEGDATEVNNVDELALAFAVFTAKHHISRKFYNNFLAGKTDHKLYRLKPRHFVLFDEVNFPDDPRQEWNF